MFKWLKKFFAPAAHEVEQKENKEIERTLVGVYNTLDEARLVAYNKAAQDEDEHEGLFVRDEGMCIGIWAPEFPQYFISENEEGKYAVVEQTRRYYYN